MHHEQVDVRRGELDHPPVPTGGDQRYAGRGARVIEQLRKARIHERRPPARCRRAVMTEGVRPLERTQPVTQALGGACHAHRDNASGPISPVRIRITRSTSPTQTFPSPIFPLLPAFTIASTTPSTSPSSTTTSTLTFGTKSTWYSAPRYTSVCPRWRPNPSTSVVVSPLTPISRSASFTSSIRWGFTMAVTSF